MEQVSNNQAGFQQMIEQLQHIQLIQMMEQPQMKSLHSSNSAQSSPQNNLAQIKVENISGQRGETKVFGEDTNEIVKAEQVKEQLKVCLPIKYVNQSNKDINLLEDSESSRQLECVQSTKIYPKQQEQRLQIISEQREQQMSHKKENNIVIEQKLELNSSPTLNRNSEEKNKSFLIACQRQNKKKAQQQQKKLQKIQKPKKQSKQQNQQKKHLKYNHQFEEYFYRCKIQFSAKVCKGGNPIEMVCVQKNCGSQAQHCINQKCISCTNSHINCNLKFTYGMFVKTLQQNVSRQKNTMQKVYESYSNILSEIQKNRQKAMRLLCVQGVNETLMKSLHQRYQQCKHASFKGKEVLKALDQLNKQSETTIQQQIRIQQKMQQDEKEIMSRLNQQMQMLLEPYSAYSLTILKSHLVTDKSELNFILEQLNYPRDMKLLYRASQYQFSISKFHQICDNEDNTFTIIKTEYGKHIGGFTPLKWKTKHGRDRTNKTFLLAINLKERLQHVNNGESAICYDEKLGPSFGGLFNTKDIEIFEQNGVLRCSTSFPNTYNWKRFFTSSQQSWRFLTGVQLEQRCKVIDYQVFKVYFSTEQAM